MSEIFFLIMPSNKQMENSVCAAQNYSLIDRPQAMIMDVWIVN